MVFQDVYLVEDTLMENIRPGRPGAGDEEVFEAAERAGVTEKNAPIVLLDEATAALDIESQMLIQRGLAELSGDKSLVVIAHRLPSIARSAERGPARNCRTRMSSRG